MDFPMDPHELPNFAAIYKDDEPVELDETIVLQQRAPALRKSNKTIRPSTVAQAVVPAASAVPNELSGWMQQMMMFSQFMQQQQQQAQQQGGHEVVHLLQPRGAKRQKALMPPDASDTPTAPAAPPAAQPAASPAPPAASAALPAASAAPPAAPIAAPPTPPPAAAPLLDLPPLEPDELEVQTDGHIDTVAKRPSMKPSSSSNPKAHAKAGAKTSAKAGAKACVKASAKAGAKAGAKAKAKASGSVKPVVERQKYKGGWVVEVKLRPTGQKDKSYIGPNGKVYRMQHEAESAGFVAKTK